MSPALRPALAAAAAVMTIATGGCSVESRADLRELFAEDDEPSEAELPTNRAEMRRRAAEARQSLEKTEAQVDEAMAEAESEMEEAMAEMEEAMAELEGM